MPATSRDATIEPALAGRVESLMPADSFQEPAAKRHFYEPWRFGLRCSPEECSPEQGTGKNAKLHLSSSIVPHLVCRDRVGLAGFRAGPTATDCCFAGVPFRFLSASRWGESYQSIRSRESGPGPDDCFGSPGSPIAGSCANNRSHFGKRRERIEPIAGCEPGSAQCQFPVTDSGNGAEPPSTGD